jgi:NitT/TauT family transport system ATP-binding protein
MLSDAAAPPPAAPSRLGVRVRVDAARRVFPGGVAALDGVDLDVAAGEFVALLGPSGCGKSTLLRLVAGLDHPDAGAVSLERASGARPSIAFVFQDAHLLPFRDVLDNVALPLELRGTPRAERRRAAASWLEHVGLTDATSRYPAELSGGMRMRASLARALVTEPDLLLLDEPFAALDELTRQRLDDLLRALWIELGMTVLFVTHSVAEAVYLSDRAVVLSHRPARVLVDRPVPLGRERASLLRTEPAFAREMRALGEALERDAKDRGLA